MTRVKICGLNNIDDVMAAVEAGADLVGFVLADSPRKLSLAAACSLIAQLPQPASAVLVLRDQPLDEILRVAHAASRCVIQLHGDEPPEFADAIPNAILRRISVGNGDTTDVLAGRMGRWPASMHLLDPGAGSGRTFDWSIARELDGRVFLAGGLTPENVGEAIRLARPYGVDVSSGVEQAPGRKNPKRIAAFIQAVREADDRNDA